MRNNQVAPKLQCPSCGKKGITQWRLLNGVRTRRCRYCDEAWGLKEWLEVERGGKPRAQPRHRQAAIEPVEGLVPSSHGARSGQSMMS